MLKLPPQRLKDSDWSHIAHQLAVIFEAEVIDPVIEIIKQYNRLPVENASTEDALRSALRTGRVQYDTVKGIFSGKFSAQISTALKRLGAKFYKRDGTFRLESNLVPAWIRSEASNYWLRARIAHEMIVDELNKAVGRVMDSNYNIDAKHVVSKLDEGWRASARKLEVQPKLTERGEAALAEHYSTNLSLEIKKWLNKDILALRRDVDDNARAGYRFDSLILKVQQRKAVSLNKARFLARQETGLFMSEYRAQRFIDAGVEKYQWSTSHDGKVRPADNLTPAQRRHAGNHRALDGQVFSYKEKAPAHFMSSHKPCNPGMDYNCRCVDIPLVA